MVLPTPPFMFAMAMMRGIRAVRLMSGLLFRLVVFSSSAVVGMVRIQSEDRRTATLPIGVLISLLRRRPSRVEDRMRLTSSGCSRTHAVRFRRRAGLESDRSTPSSSARWRTDALP